jgi:CRISPR-associated protein Csx10
MLGNQFTIKLTMESDWHVGTGAGIPGSTDRLINRDADGFPQIPAKTIAGIWRDAMERLCDGLGENWSDWVEVIFGSQPNVERIPDKKPVPAIFSVTPARISSNLRAKIGNDVRLKQALTFTKVGVKIDEESGTAATDMLRLEEMGRAGTVLEATVELEKDNEIISALLILSAGLVERIGAKRRRGAGKCKLEIAGITDDATKEAVKTIRQINGDQEMRSEILEQIRQVREDEDAEHITLPGNDSDWQTCEYTLTLETPVSVVTAVLGNVSETLDFIPGTYLISHFVRHLGQGCFTAIQNGDFQVSPATISIEGKRSLPVPLVFAQEKANREKVYNRLLETLEGKPQTKPVREGFISVDGDRIAHASAPKTILMHNSVNDEYQRPTAETGGLYSRQAIKAGTVLRGEVRFRNLDIDFSKLNGTVRLGTSKKDDYGLAKIKFASPKKFEPSSVEKNDALTVYLASDVMLRNRNLRQTNSVEDLAEAIGLDRNTQTDFQLIQVRRVESWQVSWGLPRPTLTVMQAGSVVRFKTDQKIDIARLEATGIGERRGEGYGQIIFNPKFLENPSPTWEKKDADKFAAATADGEIEDIEFAKLIEKTAWQNELKLAVSKAAMEDVLEELKDQIFGFKDLTMSQIGGLRSAIMRLKSKDDVQIVRNWLGHLEGTANRLDSWGQWRIDKVKDILKDDAVWTTLGTHFSKPTSLIAENNLKDELWAEAVKSLFQACQLAHKRELERRKSQSEGGQG